jgi:hypothetical protein
MDPYLERHWRAVHHRIITYAGDRLQETLPAEYRVELQERVFVSTDEGSGRSTYPDVHVVEHAPARNTADAPEALGAAAVAEPLLIHWEDDPVTETWLEIIDANSGNRVITAIEFLSPTNKTAGAGNQLFKQKQKEYREGGVSLVEIDLTREGDRRLAWPQDRIPRSHRTTYQVLLRRWWKSGVLEAYRAPLQERLPIIPIPLRESAADATLDLQALVDQCYRNGRYGEEFDYRYDPEPPLSPEDTAWADQLLKAEGKR